MTFLPPPSSPSPRTAEVVATDLALTVSEIYPSIQGESTHAGRPCVFIRTTGCDLRCRWCDTEYAFHGGEKKTLSDILATVRSFGIPLVEITGGEPLLHASVPTLCAELLREGFEVLIETSGSQDITVLPVGVKRILDLKAPGSGMTDRMRWENLDALRPGDEIKIVIADRADYEWARQTIAHHDLPPDLPILFSPVHGELAPQDLAAWIVADQLPVRLQVQLHKYLWPNTDRGV